ncbi:uncharacterized protein LOC125499678 [Athalia rosae]|uniref:uncharacterized protein LOC125499678 n=1 Tax=Athalia rosae TaxID=37344 RepID=UPI002033607A|nr:uncharacterized protein LOC125499678 [Athalia rosae]XP_048511267.1 uncharacterized protein LOC125499678 [Athalia rosae]XP_048511268.1 uncharacterized protein LOC125499678 [Athalia rosae]
MIGQRTDSLRQELRETTWLERKYHRNLAWNKNRPVLGEIIDNEFYTPEFVKTKAKELKKKSLSINEFQQLQNAFLQSKENISAFFSIDNILDALVRELSGNNPECQLAAASCCCNLALGNTKTCTALAKATVPYLLATSSSINFNLVDICIWTIGNLAAGSEKAFKILYAQDCSRILVSLLQRCDLVLLPSVIYAIMHFTYIGYKYIQDSEMIDVTRAIIQRYTHYLDPNMIWLLAILSSKSTCIEYILPLLPSLVEWLHVAVKTESSDVLYTTGVVWILGNIVSETSGEAANILLNNRQYSDGEMKLLLDKLLRHQHTHLRRETLWLIGNLYNHSIPQLGGRIRALIFGLSSLRMAAFSIGASF